jgi:acyl dehydratase
MSAVPPGGRRRLADSGRPEWHGIEVGAAMAPLVEAPLTITDFVRYQGAAGDQNPMHHDTGFAQAAGYPGPFAVGMRQAAVLADYAAAVWGASNVRRFSVQFREQAWPGDVLTYSGTVVARREEGGTREVDLDVTVTRQTGQVHIRGQATFVIDEPGERGVV